jgi:heme-degrading monooxygenase HmoA
MRSHLIFVEYAKTFRVPDCPGGYLLFSTWNSLADWSRWLKSEADDLNVSVVRHDAEINNHRLEDWDFYEN